MRLFGLVDGRTGTKEDRAMYQTPPFDLRRIQPPYTAGLGQVSPAASVPGQIVSPADSPGLVLVESFE